MGGVRVAPPTPWRASHSRDQGQAAGAPEGVGLYWIVTDPDGQVVRRALDHAPRGRPAAAAAAFCGALSSHRAIKGTGNHEPTNTR